MNKYEHQILTNRQTINYEKNVINDCLAVLTVGVLGSCSKINERLDNLDKRIDGIVEANGIILAVDFIQ